MIAITCEKCRRRFTPTADDLRTARAAAPGKKYGLVTCPHCGKGNKMAVQRLEQALRFEPAASEENPPAEPGMETTGRGAGLAAAD